MADNVIVRVPEQQFIRGEDGYSPEVTIEDIAHGHRVTITDREHPEGQSVDLVNGISAYEQAVAGGYEGTEAEFNEELAAFDQKVQDTEQARDEAEFWADGAINANQWAQSARDDAYYFSGQAEKWAVGKNAGQDVPSSDPTYHNNAKYYAQEAGNAIAAVNAAKADALQAVENKSTTEQAAVEQKGEEVIDSIPADYTELSEAVNSIYNLNQFTGVWSSGGYNSATGTPNNTSLIQRTRIRISAFDADTSDGIKVVVPPGMKCVIYQYENNASNTYITYSGDWETGTVSMRGDNKKYKISCAYVDDSDISPSAGDNVQIYALSFTDKTLTRINKAADAEAVGRLGLYYRRQLNSSDLLDNIHDNGIYVAPASNLIQDAPTIKQFTLLIFGSPTAKKCGLLITVDGDMYVRWHYATLWDTIWRRFLNEDQSAAQIDERVKSGIVKSAEFLNDYTRVAPQSTGEINVVKRAYQLVKASFIAAKTIPHFGTRLINEGTEFDGIPYSSVRPENLYVPQCVTLHTFFTALKNPNSYIYTRRMNIPDYSGHCYMGSVCSSFVAWCYGIKDTLPTTISFDTYPGFNELPAAQQNFSNIRIGDMLNKSGVHIVIVTDIFINRFGEITYVELSEETNEGSATARATIYHRDRITSLIGSGYKIYRYANIDSIVYTASPWVKTSAAETANPSYNSEVMPRRGENTNWHEGEDFVADIAHPENYTQYQLRRYATGTIDTYNITGSVITIPASLVPVGAYAVRLRGNSTSAWAYFDVIRTQGTTYETLTGRQIKVTPSSSPAYAKPKSVVFCYNNPNRGSDHLAIIKFHIFTEEELNQGYATVDAPAVDNTAAVDDIWFMRCIYDTGNFGLYSGQLTEVDVKESAVGTITTEGPYVRSQYIEDYPST